MQQLTNTELDVLLSSTQSPEKLDQLLNERSRRIQVRQVEIAEAEAAWEAEVDTLVAEDRDQRAAEWDATKMRVVLTSTQMAYFHLLMPMDFEDTWGIRAMETRLYATRATLREALEFIQSDLDTAVQYALETADYSDPLREEFIERQAAKCFNNLCGKLRQASRRQS